MHQYMSFVFNTHTHTPIHVHVAILSLALARRINYRCQITDWQFNFQLNRAAATVEQHSQQYASLHIWIDIYFCPSIDFEMQLR